MSLTSDLRHSLGSHEDTDDYDYDEYDDEDDDNDDDDDDDDLQPVLRSEADFLFLFWSFHSFFSLFLRWVWWWWWCCCC